MLEAIVENIDRIHDGLVDAADLLEMAVEEDDDDTRGFSGRRCGRL